MKNMFKHNRNRNESWLEKRLVWMAGEVPEQELKYDEKLESGSEPMIKIAEKLKDLKMPEVKISAPPSVLKLRAVLGKEVEKPELKALKIKNLEGYLIRGLGEKRVKVEDVKNPEKRNKAVDDFLVKNKVGSFTIEGSYWTFKTNENPPKDVPQPNELNDTDTEGPKGKEVLSKDVKDIKVAERAKKEAEKKADEDRQNPDKLKEAASASIVLKDVKSVKDLAESLAKNLTPEGRIKATELQASLDEYKEAYWKALDPKTTAGKTPEQKDEMFLKDVAGRGFDRAYVKNGEIFFSNEKGDKKSDNPLSLDKNLGDGKTAPREIWAHPKLAEARSKEVDAKVAKEKADIEAKKAKETPFDQTEASVVEMIKPGTVDARYLPAMKAILSYDQSKDVDFKIPINDVDQPCKFFKTVSGNYIITLEGTTTVWRYTPEDKGPGGLKEAQKYFAENLNNGKIFQKLQVNTVKDPANYKMWNVELKDDPKQLAPDTLNMKIRWPNADNPEITVKVLPNGELEVTVKQNDLDLTGKEQPYKFTAGGFQDMIRSLRSLQKFAETPKDKREALVVAEKDRRFLEQVRTSPMANSEAGKILRVTSGRNMTIDRTDANQVYSRLDGPGFNIDFDWMQKIEPTQHLNIIGSPDGYALRIEPSGQLLGFVAGPLDQNFDKLLKIVADQREMKQAKEGEKVMEGRAQNILDQFNKNNKESVKTSGIAYDEIGNGVVELGSKVKISAISANGTAYLSLDGTAPRMFKIGMVENGKLVPNEVEIVRAVKEGYLGVRPEGLAGKKKVETIKSEPPKPGKVEFRWPGVGDKKPEAEMPLGSKVKEEVVKDIKTGIANPLVKENIGRYLGMKLESVAPAGKDAAEQKANYSKVAWEALAKLVDKPAPASDADKKAVLVLVNKPEFAKKFDEKNKESVKTLGLSDESMKKLEKMPRMSALIRSTIEDLNNLKIDNAEPGKLDAAKKAYMEGLKNYAESFLGKLTLKQISAKIDQENAANMAHGMRYPSIFCKDFIENEKKREAHDTWEKEAKAKPGEPEKLVEPSTTPISVESKVGIVEQISDAKEKDDTTKEILGSFKLSPELFEKYRRLVLGKVEPVKLDNKDYKSLVWKTLAELAKQEDPKGDAAKQKEIQKALSGKDLPEGYKEKIKAVPEAVQKLLEKLPSTLAFVAGIMDSLNTLRYVDLKLGDPADSRAAKKEYTDGVAALVKAVLDRNPKKAGVLDIAYDKTVGIDLMKSLKNPQQYMKEYGDRIEQKQKWEAIKKEQAALKAYEDDKNDNGTSLKKFEKSETLGGIVPEALPLIQNTKGIDMENVWLSKIEGNSAVTNDTLSFNVKAGIAPNQVPMTIHIYKVNGQLTVAAADGWNNKDKYSDKVVAVQAIPGKGDPVKYAVDDLLTRGTFSRLSVPEAPKVEAPKPPAGPEKPKPKKG